MTRAGKSVIGLAALVIVALAVALALRGRPASTPPAAPPPVRSGAPSIAPPDVAFVDITRQAGITFQHLVALQAADGWLRAETMSLQIRAIAGTPPRLRIEDALDASIYVEI